MPLTKPDHLEPAPARRLSFATLALGIAAFLVVALSTPQLWGTPDWRISVPCFAVTAIAAAVAAVRERGGYPLWLAGLGLATAALVLGWVLLLAVVVGATALLILILHTIL